MTLEQLAEKFDARLRAKLVTYFKNRHMEEIADDLTHEVFLRLRRKLREGVVVFDLHPYAFGIARIVLLEERRKNSQLIPFSYLSPEEIADVSLAQDERFNPAPRLEQEELAQLIEDCLQELPPEDTELLFKYALASKDARKELATQLGITTTTLKVKVHRIRQRFKQSLRRKRSRAKLGL